MESGLHSLLLCVDDKVVRVLRRVLGEMEIGVEHCLDADTAVQKLTRQRFEAVIVDCSSMEVAARMLKGTQSSPVNKRAITVAILDGETTDGQKALKNAFALGAHFVLFKPISQEKTKSSLRAVRALMKRERRRHARIPVELPVEILTGGGSGKVSTVSADLGENGIAIKAQEVKLSPAFQIRFTLPGYTTAIECGGEVAWESKIMKGVRFKNVPPDTHEQLRLWVARQISGADVEESAVNCKLTDLSLNACYLQTESPFPVRTRANLIMKIRASELQVEGIVRVMHPGAGMGIEFTQHTANQKSQVEEFINSLMNAEGAVPNIQVRPDAIDSNAPDMPALPTSEKDADPLLTLFATKADVPAAEFREILQKQRGVPEPVSA
jgi:CheY-like chemotaxis protein